MTSSTDSNLKARIARAVPFVVIAVFMLYWCARLAPDYMYNGDELVKYAQTRGLLDSNFQKESPVYPAGDLDGDFAFSPLEGTYVIKMKGKTVGPFPIAFSVLTAPLAALGGHVLPLAASMALTLLLLYFLRRFWAVSNFVLLFAGLGTWTAIYGIFYSEVVYFLLLLFTGMSLWLKPFAGDSGASSPDATSSGRFLTAGLLMGLSAWLRLEGALFFACLAMGFLIARARWNPLRERSLLLVGTGASLAVLGLLLFNYGLYEHPLGPRFLVNEAGFAGNLAARFRAVRVLLFMGDVKPGFFLYVPLIGLVFANALRPRVFKALDQAHRAMLIGALIFLPLASFLAPNDGVSGWGPRYLIAALPPGLLLLHRFLIGINFSARGRFSPVRLGLLTLAAFSAVITILGYLVLGLSGKQLRAYQKEFRAIQADVRLFQNQVLAGHLGLTYLELKVLKAEDAQKLKTLLDLLRRRAPGKTLAFHYKPVPPEMAKLARKHNQLNPRRRIIVLSPKELTAYKKILSTNLIPIEEKQGKHTFAAIYRIPGPRATR